MFKKYSAIVVLLVATLCPVVSDAGIIITVANQSFTEGNPINLNVFARRETSTDENLLGLTADFELPVGIFNSVPGAFGQTGSIGDGTLASSSIFSRDPVDENIASLSFDFAAQTGTQISLSDTLLATLSINPTGLALGTYDVNFLGTDAQGVSRQLTSRGVAGSFTITAVPEPSTMLLIASASVIGVIRHRRHRVALA